MMRIRVIDWKDVPPEECKHVRSAVMAFAAETREALHAVTFDCRDADHTAPDVFGRKYARDTATASVMPLKARTIPRSLAGV